MIPMENLLNDTVTIYGKEGCGYCILAKSLCEEKGFTYTYKTLEKDFTIEELYGIVPFKTFPQIFYNDKSVGGYTEFKAIVDNLES